MNNQLYNSLLEEIRYLRDTLAHERTAKYAAIIISLIIGFGMGFSSKAQAATESVCTTSNKAGGTINLTLQKNSEGNPLGYTVVPNGDVQVFIYDLVDNSVLAYYPNGRTTKMYPMGIFDCSVLDRGMKKQKL